MSRRRNYTPDTMAVMERFFSTIEELQSTRSLVGGISGYCAQNGIDKRHLYAQRDDRTRGYFEVAWIIPLVRDYGINPEWLLTGKE